MKNLVLLSVAIGLLACSASNREADKAEITAMLDAFNTAAANADFDAYFSFYADSSTFIGTDATENWSKTAFMAWSRPYFEKKKTWKFKSVQRNIYFGKEADIAWFDELLDTQMKICRGSGVVTRQKNGWKVQQYVLSMTIPNENIKEVLKIKAPIEDSLLGVLSRR